MWVGVEGGSRRVHVYLRLIHNVVQQKLTQHCKVITLQLKEKETNLLNMQGI